MYMYVHTVCIISVFICACGCNNPQSALTHALKSAVVGGTVEKETEKTELERCYADLRC